MPGTSKPKAPAKVGPPEPMAPAYYKDDSITFDTSNAPWMEFAQKEMGKNIKANGDYDSFAKLFYISITQHQREAHVAPADRQYLLKSILDQKVGENLKDRNPEIAKYFGDIKTDPALDRKGRSWNVSPVEHDASSWSVTAWCAAFVNWCLKQAGSPHLGYATAASWLRFGTPLPGPKYGCVTIVPPANSTGSTTGHVAFYVETKGKYVALLGGNQGHEVNISHFGRVLGYRWPTEFNYYLLDKRASAVV